MKRIICITVAILALLISASHASTITFDTDIWSIETSFNVDFSSRWFILTDNDDPINNVGFFMRQSENESKESIDFTDGPVSIQSAAIISSGGVLSGYMGGFLVNSTPLPMFQPTTINLISWGYLDRLVFDSYMVSLDNLVFEAQSSPVPIPSALWLFSAGLISLIGVRKRYRF